MAKKKEVINMTAIAQKIDKAINTPQKPLSESEAKRMLQQYGILDSQGKIMPAYREILTEAKKDDGKKQV